MSKFSAKEAFKFGWATVKANVWFFIALFAAVILIYIGFDRLAAITKEDTISSTVVGLASWILQILISIGLIRVPLKFIDGQKAEFGDLVTGGKWFFKYFAGSLLYMLIVLGGLILLVVPGVIWAVRFQFFGYLIIDRGLGPVEALKKSWAITKGSFWDLIIFSVLLALVNALGVLALVVGTLITAPISLLAMAFVYRKLLSSATPAPAITA